MNFKKYSESRITPYDRVIKYLLPLIPRSVKPNHLTFIRLVFTPVLIVWLIAGEYGISLVLFIILALTDMFDGAMARLRNQITDWGKIWDPIADKLLIGSTVIILLIKVNLTLTILVIAFELMFIIGGTFVRMNHKDIEIQANTWGKIKMNLQAFGGGFLILGVMIAAPNLIFTGEILLYSSLFFALISLLTKGI